MDAGSGPQQRDALAEGRRIYMGNLLYSVQPGDVEDLLRQAGFAESFEKLHISIDPVSGRNPGYCFAEFTTREEADRALEALPGSALFNRQIKVGPCNPKTPSQSRGWGNSNRSGDRSEGGHNPTFQRWGDWKGNDSKPARREGEQGPYGAIRHLDNRSQRATDKAQLYIGGLGMMTSQEQHDAEMQDILAGFEFVAIGKRITPRAETRATPGNHHYCFVDFSSAEEADRALQELNGKAVEGGNLRVSVPRSKGPAFEPNGTNYGWSRQSGSSASGRRPENGRQEGQEGQERPERREPTEKQRTIMTSNNWRSAAGSK
ncbi:hypothetical protein CHGG_01314 [Chaetomium globosum CBS 148.51]|uniref:RRM domain-containing protein n=1 Tax=Chaetomium globosum (strain ATCC 6205 / CBS 148.51 / DSM 1962 / NBRC 6347 / NRRL 1970) TaxID=306901 RepID=Q2HEP0_CHAGB|nr:uncharacterized protein CHGG_01314 [Chaetomium globosum CBS 148.51]EAQ93079.1 hypothetical protein CHGG_01314 [Chaetomium globosum CBS 148.51]